MWAATVTAMTRRPALAAVVLGAVLALTGCDGGDTAPDPIIPTGTPTPPMESPSEPTEGGIPGPQDPAARTYPDTPSIVTAISTLVPCRPDGKPDVTVYSDRSLTCFYTAVDGVEEQMTASTYLDEAQQDQAIEYFLGDGSPQPGMGVVAGDKWTVVVSPKAGATVARATGGVWMPPMPGGGA